LLCYELANAVAKGHSAQEAANRMKAAPALQETPGMDIVMPEMNGIEATYEIRKLAPKTRIVLISSHYTPEEAAAIARLFGDGNFIPKSEAAKQLIPSINRLLPDESQAHPH
jgi:DNA-binding NarL/FixJ family response regulator